MKNSEIRSLLWANQIPLWKVASVLNVSENTIGRWLREELPEDKERRIREAIDTILNEGVRDN